MTRRRRWRLPESPAAPPPASDPSAAVLADVAHALARAESAEEALQYSLDRSCPAVGAALGAVFVVEGASEMMQLAAAHAWPERWRPWLGEMRVRLGFGPAGEAAAERRVITVPDVFADPALEDWQEVARELGFRALVSVPLESGTGLRGAASYYFTVPGAPEAPTLRLLRGLADLMAATVELHALRRRLRAEEAVAEEERSAPVVRKEATEDNGSAVE